jgi:dihydroorotase
VILPAATDVHVHLRDPGPEADVETFSTGTIAAALGGIGLLGEMPNTVPPVTDLERLEAKEARARGRAAVDVLLYALPTDVRSVRSLSRHAGGFKLYLSPTTEVAEAPSDQLLSELLAEIARHDLPLVVHAEEPRRFALSPPALDPAGWDRARPALGEAAAVRTVLEGPPRLRLHIAHATNSGVVASVRNRGVSCEATPHHLLLSNASGTDARFKVNPPLRDEATRAALWSDFAAGKVPILASDHAPHSVESKSRGFDTAPSGVPGLQTSLPLMLAKVARGELALDVLVRAACDRPARLLGQPLGRLSLGHRADLLVVDFRARGPLRVERLRSPCGWSPFDGFEAVFPLEHWREGERIVDGGEYVGRPGGRVVRPEYSEPHPEPD